MFGEPWYLFKRYSVNYLPSSEMGRVQGERGGGGKKKGGAPLTQEPTNKATVKLPKSPCSPSSIHSPGHTCQLQ